VEQWFCLLADNGGPTPLLPANPAGWAGWASFLTSGGVLVWLLFWHLPAKDKQLKELLDGKDSHVVRLSDSCERKLEIVAAAFKAEGERNREEWRREGKEKSEDFKGAMTTVVQHCEKELVRTVAAFRAEMEEVVRRNQEDRNARERRA
jgi:hypothetical protein